MEKQWNKVPLAVIIGAILAAPAYADDFEVKAGNVQLSADNVLDVEFNDPDTNTLNSSVINGSAFDGAIGVVHTNVAAGFFNQGSNQAAMGARGAVDDPSAVSVDAKSAQGSDGENIIGRLDIGGDGDSTSEITGGAFAGAQGIIGANATSGIANLQSNNVAMGNAEDADGLDVTALTNQQLGGLERDGADAEGNVIDNVGIDNVAKIDSAFGSASGVTGVNVSAGTVNQQANSVALANYVDVNAEDPTNDSSPVSLGATPNALPASSNNQQPIVGTTETPTTVVKAQGTQSVTLNTIDIDGEPIESQDNSADLTNSFGSAGGIVGVNIVAGDGNAQSNSVALAKVALGSQGEDSISVQASGNQSVTENKVTHVNNGNDPQNNIGDNGAHITSSGTGASGIIGANVGAGQANAQTNNVAVALAEPNGNGPIDTLATAARSTQSVMGNSMTQKDGSANDGSLGQSINDASISGSFNGASGIIGTNAAAGQFNAQSNQVALSHVDGWINTQGGDTDSMGVVNASSSQTVYANSLTGIDEADYLANSTAQLTNSFDSTAQGIVGANIAAGQANAQSNNVAVSNVTGDADQSELLAESDQSLSMNSSPDSDSVNVDRNSTSSLSSTFSSGVSGVIGVNIASGQANAQSNNVALAQYAQQDQGNALESTAKSAQTVGGENSQLASATGTIDNDASISDSFSGDVSGIVGVNIAAGQANAQANNVALAAYSAGEAQDTVSATASSSQTTQNNSVGVDSVVVPDPAPSEPTWPIDNDASITGSFSNVSGVVGANVAAGQSNAQANNAAIAVRTEDDGNGAGNALASSTQHVVNNSVTSDNASGSDPVAAYAVSNNALINPSFSSVSGIAGVNVAAGQANVQANNVAMTNSAVGMASVGDSDLTADTAKISSSSLSGTVALNSQEIDGSQIELAGDGIIDDSTPAENEASISGSFGATTGIAGVNVAAGQSNAQSNNVAISADTSPVSLSGTTVTAAVSLQEFDQVDATLGAGFENAAELTDSFNSNTNGIAGVNVVAGQANAQTNNVALSSSASDSSAALAGNAQIIGAQLNSAGTGNTGTAHSMLVINNSFDNTADLTSSFNGAKGILGVNIASGQLNGQANNVAVAVSDASVVNAGALNVQASVINEVQYQAAGAYTATLGNGVFDGAQGIIGTNVAVGVANGQSNNVSLQVTGTNATGTVLAANVQGNFANGVQGTSGGQVDLAAFDDVSVENAQLATFAVANNADTSDSIIQSVGNYSNVNGGYNGAKGIIGVNVATGMGNLQSNNVTLVAAAKNN